MNAILFPALVTETLPIAASLSETLHCFSWFPMITPVAKAPAGALSREGDDAAVRVGRQRGEFAGQGPGRAAGSAR